MVIKKHMIKYLSTFLVAIFLLQVVGCGTIMYPDRRGQTAGRIDPGVAILDGVGLLLFLIPGVIAFGVDFATGAIYLPGKSSETSMGPTRSDIVVVEVNPEDLNFTMLEKTLRDKAGAEIDLAVSDLRVYQLNSEKDIRAHIGELVQ
jgi:hypothetical protein